MYKVNQYKLFILLCFRNVNIESDRLRPFVCCCIYILFSFNNIKILDHLDIFRYQFNYEVLKS